MRIPWLAGYAAKPKEACRDQTARAGTLQENFGQSQIIFYSRFRMSPRRVVLDTNIWLDWLVFVDPSLLELRKAVAAGKVEIVINAACEAELERVLAYDLARHTLDAAGQAACIAECRRIARRVDTAASEVELMLLPRCVDPDDQKFLELALAARAECLVTKDHKLLELAHRTKAFRIRRPAGP